MTNFDELRPLTNQDKEVQMLLEVTEEVKKQEKGSINQKSGKASQKVVRKHLTDMGANLAQNLEAKIQEVETKMNLLFLLNAGIDQNKPEYSIHDVNTVLKITNNAVGKTTSEKIRSTFEKFARHNQNLRFAVVVLSERLSYNYPIKFDNVFTLIARRKRAHKLYLKETVIRMQKDEELRKPIENGWDDLKGFLTEGK